MNSDLLIPMLSVAISALVAIAVAKYQVQSALEKVDVEYKRKATELLFQKRINVYPQLHSELLSFVKDRYKKTMTKHDLISLTDSYDSWEIENAIFMSPLGLEKLRFTRKVFAEALEGLGSDEEPLTKKKLREVLKEIYSLQMVIKTEIGVLEADGFHNPSETKRFNEILNLDRSRREG